jgi:fluoride ion exporter CrcB/FEX
MPQLVMLFVVNLFGAAFLGFVNSLPAFASGSSKAFWGIGFAGGFTTMSGVALWVVASSADAYLAPFTAIAMFISGVAAYLLALRFGNRGNHAKSPIEADD